MIWKKYDLEFLIENKYKFEDVIIMKIKLLNLK